MAGTQQRVALDTHSLNKMSEIVCAVNKVYSAVDGLELSIENIELSAENIDLNTDALEAKLDSIDGKIGFAQDTFQLEDCDGNPIGTEQDVIKTVVLNKTTASICNTADIVDPIVDAINLQQASAVGKAQDFMSWTAAVNATLTIPLNKFSTVSMLASKGEFKIENSANNFATDITTSSGTLNNFIEISEDGVGTATGSSSVPQGFDTRSNAYDIEETTNSFLITCVREGTLQLDLYK
jgi:hypothetical protein